MMNTEKELIGKLRELRQIKPNKDWVVLTKSQILGEEKKYTSLFLFRPAYAGLIALFILIGLFGFAQNSLPGDFLYPIKKISEKAQAVFVSEEEKPNLNFELANKRLEELAKIAQENRVRNLPPAIDEAEVSISEVAKNLVKSEPEKADRETIDRFVNLRKNLEKVEKTLAIQIGSQEDQEIFQGWEKEQAEMLIEDLETRSLTEEQEEFFEQAKEDFQTGNYSEALIKLWQLSQ